ncbi:MAG: hypothetical protein L6R41_002544 [Letrouitia leprolyta]|nr:MAG: hypothetical protein L6R41_002544 [Letrouitia leprolyta]
MWIVNEVEVEDLNIGVSFPGRGQRKDQRSLTAPKYINNALDGFAPQMNGNLDRYRITAGFWPVLGTVSPEFPNRDEEPRAGLSVVLA